MCPGAQIGPRYPLKSRGLGRSGDGCDPTEGFQTLIPRPRLSTKPGQAHLAINAQHFGHLFCKLGVAVLQVITVFMRLHLLLVENLAHSALRKMGEARVPFRRSMLASVTGQKPRCPQFVRIAQVLRLPARQRHQPRLGFDGDRRLPTRARSIVQRDDRTFHRGPLDATLHGLMMDSKRLAHREKRWLFPITQQYPCPLPRLAGSIRDCAIDLKFTTSASPSDISIARRHAAILFILRLKAPDRTYRSLRRRMNPPLMTTFMESIV